MSLTMSGGPLAAPPPPNVNYELIGPAHKLLLTPFPRRVRATFGGRTVLDTTGGQLLHETNLLPVLYVPRGDVDQTLLEPTELHTHCPYKGDASYWTLRAGERVAENAVWAYPDPIPAARWLAEYQAFYHDRLDAWFDEDEEIFGHLRDPFHRVDVRPAAARVEVRVDGRLVAASSHAMVLSETGLPNRYYLPRADIELDALTRSDTATHCPYKGSASYWSVGSRRDIAWSYEEPFDGAQRIAGHLSFLGDGVDVQIQPSTTTPSSGDQLP